MAKTTAPVSIHQHRSRDDVEFHVTYLDTDTGRVRREDFHDLAAAERFASAQLRDEDSWAVVDQVKAHHTSRMVA
ncbi:hypothetical protein FQP90_01930 [Paenarthrobacter nitroguajacolicus]|uniref:Uncharacterized protein n=1 Tax=Paenarthrobacter nitroguajacolicus TaxID=211146 RepID=A0A558HCR1_PAENT|nr:hypothetical protein [Paenarthrobacter nitroguajacolicus]TVU66923.1 hypothetical protein FQP90_01930 [Paenarthrobacter nitroguajacolicus]